MRYNIINMTNENKKTIDVLFVEDKVEQIERLKSIQPSLENKYKIKIAPAQTFKDYEHATGEKDFDVTLTDMFIPYSFGEENKSKSLALWKDIFDEIKSGIISKDGTIREAWSLGGRRGCMTGIRDFFNGEEVAEWKTMHASDTLGEYFNGKDIDSLVLDTIGKPEVKSSDYTGPFGVKIFLEEYFKKGHAAKLMTSDHCHGCEGSPFMMYLQHKGMAEYGKMPFVYLGRSGDLRLSADTEKPGTPESIESIIVDGLFMHNLKEAKISDEDFIAINEARKFLNKHSVSVKDIYEGKLKEEVTENSIKKKQLKSLQNEINENRKYLRENPEQTWMNNSINEGLKTIDDLENDRISIYREAGKEQAECIKKGTNLINRLFYEK